jgi:hypothetical protein
LTPAAYFDTQRPEKLYLRNRIVEGKRAYSLYDAIRRVLDPLRRDWDTFSKEERELIIGEIEGFLRSIKPPDEH